VKKDAIYVNEKKNGCCAAVPCAAGFFILIWISFKPHLVAFSSPEHPAVYFPAIAIWETQTLNLPPKN
jgi:hypothetical protein